MDLSKLRQLLQSQSKEKEEWMQKYYSQMTESEVRDRMLNKTLGVLESEVQRLSTKASELSEENATLREESQRRRKDAETLRTQAKQNSDTLKKERRTHEKELEEFGKLLGGLRAKLRIGEEKPQRKLSTKLASEYLQQISSLRSQLDLLSSSLKTTRGRLSSNSTQLSSNRRSSERVKPRPSSNQLQNDVEEMITRIETRLQRARELTQ